MVEITPVAAELLLRVRERAPDRPVLRVYVSGRTCCGYTYGLVLDREAAPEDAVVESEGITVAIDPGSLPYVEGARVDHVESSAGTGFLVTNARHASACSCGGRGAG